MAGRRQLGTLMVFLLVASLNGLPCRTRNGRGGPWPDQREGLSVGK